MITARRIMPMILTPRPGINHVSTLAACIETRDSAQYGSASIDGEAHIAVEPSADEWTRVSLWETLTVCTPSHGSHVHSENVGTSAISLSKRARVAGLALGRCVEDERWEYAFAGTSGRPHTKLQPDSVFQIGSITKLFTATLLAQLTHQGTVTLDTPVDALLPDSRPARGAPPTLLSLATHTSGLPRLGWPMLIRSLWHSRDPYAGTTVHDLVRIVRKTTVQPGRFRYSNLGYALLGQALAAAAGEPFHELIRKQVIEPLGLARTSISDSSNDDALSVVGHAGRRTVPQWRFDAFSPAGGMRSTVRDLLSFCVANSAPAETPLRSALLKAHLPRVQLGNQKNIGLGWLWIGASGEERLYHNGATAGFYAALCLDPSRRIGVVVLTNSSRTRHGQHEIDHTIDELMSITQAD